MTRSPAYLRSFSAKLAMLVLAGVWLSACGDSEPLGTRSLSGTSAKSKDKKTDAAAVEEQVAAAPESFTEEDFVEVDTEKRDPFRSFAEVFRSQNSVSSQRRVVMSEMSVDELRLIALVTGTSEPLAMFIDPSRVGYTVRPGDYIGRAEVVQSSGGEAVPIALNWRVDRIRPDGVVLTREDPNFKTSGPVPTRFIPLNDQGRGKLDRYQDSIVVTEERENEVPSFQKLNTGTRPSDETPPPSSDQ